MSDDTESLTIKLRADAWRRLLAPVLPHVDKSGQVFVLSRVLIWTDDTHIYAAATDRVALGVQRVQHGGWVPSGLHVTIDGTALTKHLRNVPKAAARRHQITDGTFDTEPGRYYPRFSMLPSSGDGVTVGVDIMSVNPDLMGRYSAAKTANPDETVLFGHATDGSNTCIYVTVGPDFAGVLMPVNLGGDTPSMPDMSWARTSRGTS